MGTVNFGAPKFIIDALKSSFDIPVFYETGTFQGGTSAWASTQFQTVYTVERSMAMFTQAKMRLKDYPNVVQLLGDTREHLAQYSKDAPATMFWLDAHWCGDLTAGESDECPLLDEIALLADQVDRHFILIDDARLFLAPPPLPHDPDQWPGIDQVCDALRAKGNPYIVVHNDVIFSVPQAAKRVLQTALQAEMSLRLAGEAV